MLLELAVLDKPKKKKMRADKRRNNQRRDVLIAVTAIQRCLTLVTGDENLRDVVRRFVGNAIGVADFAKC